VTINGHKFSIPKPVANTNPPLDLEQLVNSYSPYSMVIELPSGVLQQGQNTITFTAVSSTFDNIHVELDFNAVSEPRYIPPAQIAARSPMQSMPTIGPNAVISQIGTTELPTSDDNLNDQTQFNPTVSGVVSITVDVHNDITLYGTGTNLGIAQVDLQVDRQVALSHRADQNLPAPSVKHVFDLDTRLLTNGVHELFVVAYNPAHIPSIADYGGAGAVSGTYYPIHITVHNKGSSTKNRNILLPPITNSKTTGQLMNASCSIEAPQMTNTDHQH
jgi:hypothetical protein